MIPKILLSLTVIGSFLGYAYHESTEDEEASIVTPKIPESTPQANIISTSKYRDGSYTGDIADAYYGNVQVQIKISGGQLTDVQFLEYPSDRRTSERINLQAMPILKQEAIKSQSASVDIVSGATQTSRGFRESLKSALDKAKS